MRTVRDLSVGSRFGRLQIIRDTGKKQGTNRILECRCDCGNICEVSTGHIGREVNSCGCLFHEAHSTHKKSKTRIYNIYTLMKGRCFNKHNPRYDYYGGRGITICNEWLGEHGFENFYLWSMENGYADNLSIDRIDNDGNYEPSNCRWSTNTQQVNNRRNYGEIKYCGIVKDATGYRAQVTVCGKKIYIAHSKGDIEFLVNIRNDYIDKNHLPNRKNVYVG